MGRVKSLNYRRTGKERIMKPRKNIGGYLQVQLCQEGKRKWYSVHQLVASAFCENPMGYKEVNHISEDKLDNRAENLEFCSRSYNVNYGTGSKRSAEKRRKAIIGINKVDGLILEFSSLIEASKQTNTNIGNICNCLKGRYDNAGGFYWFYADDNE